MISKIEVWGDSILRGVVLDPATRRYSRLKEASCVALSSRALGIPAENHARFGMTSEKGRVVMEREILPMRGRSGADRVRRQRYRLRLASRRGRPARGASAAYPAETFLREHACDGMPCAVTRMEPLLMTLPPIDAVRYYEWDRP